MTHGNSPSTETLSHPPGFVSFILARLTGDGHKAYVVGGALRDACMGRPITDWDVATSASPRQIGTLFHDTRHFQLKHDTVTLVDSGQHYDVTTFRGPEQSIQGDLARRDFTINAMAYDQEAVAILDPFGGRRDLGKKRIRAVGGAEERFTEDPLRTLRAIRFACELDFRIEPDTLGVLTRMGSGLLTVSPERIREEWARILVSPTASEGIRTMQQTGLLGHIVPELLEGYRKRQGPPTVPTILRHGIQTLASTEPTLVLRLSALLHDVGKPRVRTNQNVQRLFPNHPPVSARMAHDILSRLRFNRTLIHRVTHLIRHHGVNYQSHWTDGDVRRFIAAVGKEYIPDLLQLRWAELRAWEEGSGSEAGTTEEHRLLEELDTRIHAQMKGRFPTRVGDLAVDGGTVMKVLGVGPGSRVGQALEQLLHTAMEHPEWNAPQELKRLLKVLIPAP